MNKEKMTIGLRVEVINESSGRHKDSRIEYIEITRDEARELLNELREKMKALKKHL